MYFTVCALRGPGLIPDHGGVFQGIFPWLITLCQPVLSQRGRKMTQSPLNGATQAMEIEEEGPSPTMDRQWLK